MRIAVTGASGFVGGAVTGELTRQGHVVFAFGRRCEGSTSMLLPNYRQWDIRNPLTQRPIVDAIVHCAALVGDWGDDEKFQRTNVDGTERVLETFKDAERFVHVSSASVYACRQDVTHLAEDAQTGIGLLTAYARSKAQAEALLMAERPDAAILRPHIVYGPGDTTLMPRVIAARRFGCLVVPGSGRNRVSVTHILNLTHAVTRAIECRSATGFFNIADRDAVAVDDLLQTLLQREGHPTRLVHLPHRSAWMLAGIAENLWRAVGAKHAPRPSRYLVQQVAYGHTLDISRAIDMLTYDPRFDYHCAVAAQELR
ncbi:MAG TPA: NAD(P)-dependent oxidoreductase [Woeseiaceae bacterium]|nr:NAD(P)-dependent oxidoreductase [Woeseiaceae bacterium]